MNLSDRKNGLHFYINIKNFNQVILEEESNNSVNHSLHALDTFFRSIERYAKANYSNTIEIEKITGARLHMYLVDNIYSSYKALIDIASYTYNLSKLVNKEIPKYKTLIDFQIQIGACYGSFYEFAFRHYTDDEVMDVEELTTIGYAANYAAKLQGMAGSSKICISEELYDKCVTNDLFVRREDSMIMKYDQKCYYEANLVSVAKDYNMLEKEVQIVREYAAKVNLSSIKFSNARQLISFDDLSKVNCKRVIGVPLFVDVRDFTSKFEEDDSNLLEMAIKTEQILLSMYNITVKNGGVHVQFQGDREEALFHDVGDKVCVETAIIAAMRMIDSIGNYGVSIGIGGDYGRLYAAKIGARGEKDNILLGEVVIYADRLEDDKAGKNQIVISRRIFQELTEMESSLADFFKNNKDGTYVTNLGYKKYLSEVLSVEHKQATKNNAYNGAWRE